MCTLHWADGRQQGAHHPRLLGLVVGLAGDMGLRATRRLHSSAGRALRGLGAGHHRATRAGARRALTDLTGLIACADARRAGWHGRLQHVLGHIGRGRALGFEHVPGHVGLGRAWRNAGLQHILGPINRRAPVTIAIVVTGSRRPVATIASTAGAALTTGLSTYGTILLCYVYEVFHTLALHLEMHQYRSNYEAKY